MHRVWILDRDGEEIDCKSFPEALAGGLPPKGYEVTQYVINPRYIEEKLNEEMDTSQITLEGYPTERCFEPKTKVVIERWDEYGNMYPPYFHMIVSNDNVESYVGLPGYHTHRLELTEASAIAQGYHVDNIAVTYELQDVDLNYDLNLDTETNANGVATPAGRTGSPVWTEEHRFTCAYSGGYGSAGHYSKNTGHSFQVKKAYKFEIDGTYGDIRQNIIHYSDGENILKLDSIPKIWCYKSREYNTTYCEEVEVNTETGNERRVIYRKDTYSGVQYSRQEFDEDNTLRETETGLSLSDITFKVNNSTGSLFDGDYNADFSVIGFSEGLGNCHYGSYPDDGTYLANGPGYHKEDASYCWEKWVACTTTTTVTAKNLATGASETTETWCDRPTAGTAVQEYYTNMAETAHTRYESKPGNTHEIFWEEAKGTLSLCSGKTTSGAREIKLQPATEYTITTTLARSDSQGVIATTATITSTNKGSGNGYTESVKSTVSYGKPSYTISFRTSESVLSASTPILCTPVKYNLLDCLEKAILCTQVYHKEERVPALETRTSFVINSDYTPKLARTPIHETVFCEKNLWEVCSSIGYYIHAIPFIEFLNNEQFKISFRELGKNTISAVKNKKITVFNSQDIEEYFGTLDSYVKNLYSPENIVEEDIAFKTENSDYLISNDTVCAKTSEAILQIQKLSIIAKDGAEKDVTQSIVEKSIYDTFSLDSTRIPSKANAIYYTLGTTTIDGMTAKIPIKNSAVSTPPYPIQAIIGNAFFPADQEKWIKINVNDYFMRIVYNTSDDTRIKQVRPNINDMLLNSNIDRYPIHEQFHGQESKIIDSERYGNLLYGELLKTGNAYYQSDEWNELGALKEVGDIEVISGKPYYISQVESEFYDNAVFQKITYHKDFNAISKIVSIPSEPRFYEVANTSIIDRYLYCCENLMITVASGGKPPEITKNPSYLAIDRFFELVNGWLFGVNPSYPDYAVTTFRDDPDTPHIKNNMFVDTPKIEESGKQILTNQVVAQNKLLMYSSQNSLVFEWGMEDNFSAGSFVDTRVSGKNNTSNAAYYGLNFLRYCDLYGRVDLIDFALINNDATGLDNIQKLPQRVCSDKAIENAAVKDFGWIINKDNREALKSISFQVNLITDRKIYFGRAIWRKKAKPVKILLLSGEISKFSFQNLYWDIQAAKVLAERTPVFRDGTRDGKEYVEVAVTIPDDIINDVQCIAIVDGGDPDDKDDKGGMPYIYRNVGGLTADEKRYSFFVYTV